MSRLCVQILVVALGVAFSGGATAYAQIPAATDGSIERGRLDLQAEDWQAQTKTTNNIRTTDALQLRSGAMTGRVVGAPIELPFAVNGIGPH